MTGHAFIPVNTPLLAGNEKAYVTDCIESGWVSSEGPFVKKFEDAFSDQISRKYGYTVSNGTDALELAVWSLGLEAGDEVIMPTFTIVSCAAAIVRNGAVPVLVDCDPDTWNMTAEGVAAAITDKTRAIMVVHIYGLPVDMEPIEKLASKYDLKIIEDTAEAIGLVYKDKPCGSFGDVSTFSFYANKHVTMGEGGFIATDNPDLAERFVEGRNLCFGKVDRFTHDRLGWNMRITNLQAAVGLAQLERLQIFIEKKKEMGATYTSAFSSLADVRLPLQQTQYASNDYWVYGLVLEERTSEEVADVMLAFREEGIGTRPFFRPMHQQPVFREMGLFRQDSHPVAEMIGANGFYIPSGLGLTETQIERVIEVTCKILG